MSPARRVVWVVPLVLVVCALMVLPGASYLSSFALHGAGAVSAGASPGLAAGSSGPRSSNPSASSPFSGVLPNYANQPWVQSLMHTGPATKPLTSLPNINILKGKTKPVPGVIAPGYAAPPAPLGLGDFGLGVNPYSYNSSHILGAVTFNTPPNVTQPSATGVILPNNGGQHEGYVGSPYEFGIQLNTIATNITIPGLNTAFFWTQNVVNWNDTGIHFVDDTFNASGGSFGLNDIYSGCNNNTAGAQNILKFYGGVFQCVGTTIPISPADYPITIQLYNNASVNAQNRDQVSYGFRIVEAGSSTVVTGVSDTVVFLNPNATAPAYAPGFTVDGFEPTTGGFLRDSEIVIVGGIGGDNAAFRSINGSMSLQYSNLTSGGWQPVPSAYNFGGDTGETSAGIADYWTASHTLIFNQGPSLLYGLWRAEHQVSVASGDIHIAGSITPSYGFVFLGNLPIDAIGTNLSWFPTTDTGTFNAYLPPLGAPWTTHYYVQAFAAGSQEVNGTAITGSTTSYTLNLPAAPGVLRAPLYMYSNTQASQLAANISGSGTAPYTFANLNLDVNFSFNHFNDYTYPMFDLVNSQGVTQPVTIDNVTQGNDSAHGTFYFYVYSATSGLLAGPGEVLPFDLSNYTAAINIFGGTGDTVTNEVMTGITFGGPYPLMGGSLFLWDDTNAVVTNSIAQYESPGVYVGHTVHTLVDQLTVQFFATGITDVANSEMVGVGIDASFDSTAIYAYGTTGSTYSYVNVSYGGRGFTVGGDYGDPYYDVPGTVGLTISQLNVTNGGLGANITFGADTTITALSTYDTGGNYGSAGAWLDGTVSTTFNTVTAYGGAAWGVDMWNAMDTSITAYSLTNANNLASVWGDSSFTTVNGMVMVNYAAGIIADGMVDTTFTNVVLNNFDLGVAIEDATTTSFTSVNMGKGVNGGPGIVVDRSSYTTISQVYATDGTVAIVLEDCEYSTVTNVAVSVLSVGVFTVDSVYTTISGVTATDTASSSPWASPPAGLPALSAVLVLDGGLTTVSDVVATDYPAAYYDIDSFEPTVSDVNATGGMFAVVLNETNGGLFTGINAYQDWMGIQVNDGANHNVFTLGTFVDSTSYAIAFTTGDDNTIYDNNFIANNGATTAYSAAHVQVSAGLTGPNYFDGATMIGVDLGNYWSDWHSYTPFGQLAPYPVGNANYDHYPIGAPEGRTAVYFEQSGLPSGVSWSVTLNGVQLTTSSQYLVFYVLPGSYSFTAGAVAGYTVTPASGTVTASGQVFYGYLSYAAIVPSYTVSVAEKGLSSTALASGWSATVGGVLGTSTSSRLNVSLTPGTYSFQVAPVGGYSASPSSGTFTLVNGSYVLLVTFTPVTYAVTVTESGLANGESWSATVNGDTIPATGPSITFSLTNGSYTITVSNVSGYSLSASTLKVAVNGAPTGTSVTYTPTSTTSVVSTSTFNTWLGVAIAIAVIALVLGLLAVFLRGRKEPPAQSAQAWTPPAQSSTSGGAASGGGGTPGWSEGPPSGGSPPS
ncbi:MAG TPA: thermopsin family protease [Thermoplasmata archaeon]|nr:thermopsin family protease [Thermoplasmata archaeon]